MFPVNAAKFSRTAFLYNTSGGCLCNCLPNDVLFTKLAIFNREFVTLSDTNVDIPPDRKGVK